MSGYAPVKNELDQTRAIVGVDIAAETVSNKLLALRMVMLLVWVVLALLITLVVQLHYQQQDVLESNRALTADLATRNDMLKAANSRLAASNEQVRRELSRRNGYRKPLELSGNGGMIFDKYYLACHFGGPHSGDVLMLDEDHVGLYLATVPAHGVTAAFISGILKSSAASGARDPAASTAHLHIDPTQPGLVLASLNTLLLREFPDAAPVAMAYAVMDIAAATFTVAVAGSAPVFIGDPDTRKLTKWNREAGAPLGKEHGSTYPVAVQRLACNQRLVLTSTGQEDKANDALKSNVDAPAWELLQLTRQSMGEDSSILIAEVR
jgi:serine phosphatase RsbU (regulator of sigma subunit)